MERGKDYPIPGKTKLRFVVIKHSFLYKWNNGIKCVWPSGMSGINDYVIKLKEEYGGSVRNPWGFPTLQYFVKYSDQTLISY